MCVSVCYILFICIRCVQSKKRTIGAKNAWHAICINFFISTKRPQKKKNKSWRKRKWMPHGQHTLCCSCVSITDADQNLAPIGKQTETTTTTAATMATKRSALCICINHCQSAHERGREDECKRESTSTLKLRRQGTGREVVGRRKHTNIYLKRPVCIFYELVVQHNNSNNSNNKSSRYT